MGAVCQWGQSVQSATILGVCGGCVGLLLGQSEGLVPTSIPDTEQTLTLLYPLLKIWMEKSSVAGYRYKY